MDRGDWRATVQGVAEESDTPERPNDKWRAENTVGSLQGQPRSLPSQGP